MKHVLARVCQLLPLDEVDKFFDPGTSRVFFLYGGTQFVTGSRGNYLAPTFLNIKQTKVKKEGIGLMPSLRCVDAHA